MTFFNRCWQLKIQFETHKAKIYQQLSNTETGFKIEFKTQAGINTTATAGELTVTGLLSEDIAYLATNYMPDSGMLRPSLVEFSAGYEDSLALVLYGNIIETTPIYTGTSDYGIRMRIVNGVQHNQMNVYSSVAFKGRVTLRDIFANIANKLNMVLDCDGAIATRALDNYSFQGSPREQLRSLRQAYKDLEIVDRHNVLRIQSKHTHAQVRYTLSADTGLLGVPTPTPMGVQISTYLLPNLYSGDFFKLESTRLPQLAGTYKIVTVAHEGSTRGDRWQTNITALRT